MDKQTHDEMVTEFDREMKVTRAVLERVPDDKLDFTPHSKSMTLQKLANHVAIMPGWILATLQAAELDFAGTSPMPNYLTRDEMLRGFDEMVAKARAALVALPLDKWHATWTVRQGPQMLHSASRYHVYRMWDLNHTVHHRGQLNLYLRLLDIPVATIYFNSSDDKTWKFD